MFNALRGGAHNSRRSIICVTRCIVCLVSISIQCICSLSPYTLPTITPLPTSEQNKRWIDEAFGGAPSVEEIVLRLRGMVAEASGGREWAQGALESLGKASPTALKVRLLELQP